MLNGELFERLDGGSAVSGLGSDDDVGSIVKHELEAKSRETLVKYHAQSDPAKWEAKVAGRTRSIDGLPTRPTDRYIAG